MLFLTRRCFGLGASHSNVSQKIKSVGSAVSKKKKPATVITTNRAMVQSRPEERPGIVMLYNHSMKNKVRQWSLFGTLGSFLFSSGGVFAVAWMGVGVLPALGCVGATFSTLGLTGLLANSCVGRMMVDPARGRLILRTHQIFTGDIISRSEEIPLSRIKSPVNVTDNYVKFGLNGPWYDPKTWIYYRIPRVGSKTAEMGAATPMSTAELMAAASHGSTVSLTGQQRSSITSEAQSDAIPSKPQFLGAGLGGASPSQPSKKAEAKSTLEDVKISIDVPNIKLSKINGLPADDSEEYKLLCFLHSLGEPIKNTGQDKVAAQLAQQEKNAKEGRGGSM